MPGPLILILFKTGILNPRGFILCKDYLKRAVNVYKFLLKDTAEMG